MNHIRITAPVRGWEIGGGGAGRPVTREGDSSPFVKANFRSLGRRVRCFVATTEDEKKWWW